MAVIHSWTAIVFHLQRNRGSHRKLSLADEPFGFCLATGGPGELICLDSLYIGKLKGVGKVYQLSAIDVSPGWPSWPSCSVRSPGP